MRIESGNVVSHRTLLDGDLAPSAPLGAAPRSASPTAPAPVLPPNTQLAPPESSLGGFWKAIDGFFTGIGAACDSVLDGLRGAAHSLGDLVAHPSRMLEQTMGTVILVAGKTAAALQSLLHLEAPGRHLRDDERALLGRVFGHQLDLDAIVIKTGHAGIFNLVEPGRPFTLGSTIYTKQDGEISTDLLVHEATHVWQYQNRGADYIPRSVVSQLQHGEAAYDVISAVKAGASWSDLNVEQQAKLLEAAYLSGFFNANEDEHNRTLRLPVDQTHTLDATTLLRAALSEIRASSSTR